MSLGEKSVMPCSLIFAWISVFFYFKKILSDFFRGSHIVPEDMTSQCPDVGFARATSGVDTDLRFVSPGGFTFPKPPSTASTVTMMWKRATGKRGMSS